MTIDGDARDNQHYTAVNQIIEFVEGINSNIFNIKINSIQDKADFFVKLYDPDTHSDLIGYDTKARITIVKESSTGYVSFKQKSITVSTDQ